MHDRESSRAGAAEGRVALAVLLVAAALAVLSARNRAGSCNDASRLATVEALVDYHTLAIDRSVYLEIAACDRLYVDGHFYSDKAPVPQILMALWYQLLQWGGGLVARTHPRQFVYWMTLGSSGLAYVVAVCYTFRLTGILRLGLAERVALTASFALAGTALPYARQVNSHVLLLGVSAALFAGLARLSGAGPGDRPSWPSLLGLGTLAGLGYTIDLGTGPVLLAGTLLLVAYRGRDLGRVAGFALGAAPWLALHHAVNYAVGGTFGPANAVPEHFRWPGSTVLPQTLTGGWHHPDVSAFLGYAAGLLWGDRGFLCHNLPLLLAVPGVLFLLRRRVRELPELLLASLWAVGTWTSYAVFSDNYAGYCLSVRWLVPLSVPGYFVLAVLLREFPGCRPGFLVLSGWGALLCALMWPMAVWYRVTSTLLWPVVGGALLSWLGCGIGLWWRGRAVRVQEGGLAARPAIASLRRAA